MVMSWHVINNKIYLLIIFFFVQGTVFSQTTIFPFTSSWKYLDDGTDQNTAWRQVGFDDSGWQSGSGQLGYGDGDETTILNACGIPPCINNKYISYYFRKSINIPDVTIFKSFIFEMYRDDGVVIYVNGTEVYRNNMPSGTISYTTLASSVISDADETTIVSTTLTLVASQFVSGDNIIAVEVHQNAGNSSDVSWDMKLTGVPVGVTSITRGPYLQKATSTSMLIRWYTDTSVDSKVTYGTDPGNLSQFVSVAGTRTNHSVQLTGLSPYTQYYYSVGTSTSILQSGLDNYFLTSPLPGTSGKYTFWVTGDVGDGSARQKAVRDRFSTYMGNNITNGWLLLGDNAYNDGAETVYTTNFFEIYQNNIMRKTSLWPATGNHEYANSTSRQKDHNIPYFTIFDLPSSGEAGGVASNSEAYYSFDYGNIHFIALDSYIIESDAYRLFDIDGPQVQWLKQDLSLNTKTWTIVYFHHPPYSMGSHNSDTETELVKIRENIVPILEQNDVDLVLTGHSHSYERSKLMKGHFGLESTFNPAVHWLSQSSGKYNGTANSCVYTKDSTASIGGTVYVVAGSAGKTDWGQTGFPHNAMYFGNDVMGGSLILQIDANRLDGKWLYEDGNILDQFTIMKNVNKVTKISPNSGESVTLNASWVGQYNWSPSGATTKSITITPSSTVNYTVTDPYGCVTDTFKITVNPLPVELIKFTAKINADRVTLNWETASELNNDYFEVQRFINFEQIETLGRVDGKGTTPQANSYQFVDTTPIGGKSYYRLKQVDYDGKYEYSEVVYVNFDDRRVVTIFPNPGTGDEVSINMGSYKGLCSISIFDALGSRVGSFFMDITSGSNPQIIKFDTPLPTGMYFLHLKTNVGITTRKWLVK